MTERVTLYKLIRADQVEEYERDGWTTDPMPPSHHCRYRQFVATKPVEAGNAG